VRQCLRRRARNESECEEGGSDEGAAEHRQFRQLF
jgi:hypothetical protein